MILLLSIISVDNEVFEHVYQSMFLYALALGLLKMEEVNLNNYLLDTFQFSQSSLNKVNDCPS